MRNVQLKEWQKYIFPAVVIATVWGLMLLPIIIHHLPNKQVTPYLQARLLILLKDGRKSVLGFLWVIVYDFFNRGIFLMFA